MPDNPFDAGLAYASISPFDSGLATAEPTANPFDTGHADLSADDLRSKIYAPGSTYLPTEDEVTRLHEDDTAKANSRSVASKVIGAVGAVGSGFVDTGKMIGSQAGKASVEVPLAIEPAKTRLDRVSMTPTPEQLKLMASTGAEAGAQWLANVRAPMRKGLDYLSRTTLGQTIHSIAEDIQGIPEGEREAFSPRAQKADRYKDFIARLQEDRALQAAQEGETPLLSGTKFTAATGQTATPDMAAIGLPEPLPATGALLSNVVDPTVLAGAAPKILPKAVQMALARRAEIAAAKAAAEGIAQASKPSILNTVAQKAAGATEWGGQALKTAAELPGKAVDAVVEKALGPQVAEAATKLPTGKASAMATSAAVGLGLGPVASLITAAPALLKTLQKAGATIENVGKFAGKVISKPGDSQATRFLQLARDADAPEWMRAVASGIDKSGAVQGARLAGDIAKGAAKGASLNVALAAPGAESLDELGQAAGTGALFGTAGGMTELSHAQAARVARAKAGGMARFAEKQIAAGVTPETLSKAGDSAMLAAATLDQVFEGSHKIKFVDGKAYADGGGDAGSSAFYDRAKKEILVNTDSTGSRKPYNSLLHEIGHALFDADVVNKPELKEQIANELAKDGKTLDDVKRTYAVQLLAGEKDTSNFADRIDAKVAELDAASKKTRGDADEWALSEFHSEAFLSQLAGKDIASLLSPSFLTSVKEKLSPSPTKEGSKPGFLAGIKEKLSSTREKLFSPPEGGTPGTVLPGFEKPLASADLGQSIVGNLRERSRFLTGLTKEKPQKLNLTDASWGKHPAAQLHDLPTGGKGNDFVVEKPDGTIENRKTWQTKRIVGGRRKEVNAAFPTEGVEPLPKEDTSENVSLRQTISNSVSRAGTKLGEKFYALKSFSGATKAMARGIEKAIATGESLAGWYQQIGSSTNGDGWKGHVGKDTGAIEAQFKDFMPVGFVVDKQGNVLVQNYDLSALQRKLNQWQNHTGELSLGLWGGDAAAFRNDLQIYLRNHAEGKPGAEGIGNEKRDLLNAFLVGANRTFEGVNRLRPLLKGDDKQGVIRSYRLDRLETLEPGAANGFEKPDYNKQVKNLSPESELAENDKAALKLVRRTVGEVPTGKGASLPTRDGGTLLVTKSSKEGVALQVTKVDREGSPVWDREFSKEKMRDVLSDQDLLEAAQWQLRPDLIEGAHIISLGAPGVFLYRLRLRDVGPGTVPSEGLVSANGRNVIFNRPLSNAELASFEIRPIGALDDFGGDAQFQAKQKAFLSGETKASPESTEKTLDGQGGKVFTPAQEETGKPVWFSQIRRVIESNKLPEKAPAAQVAAVLRNPQNGIKSDEMKWTGVDDFIKEKQAKGEKISKAELTQFLDSNNVQVKEVEKGAAVPGPRVEWASVSPESWELRNSRTSEHYASIRKRGNEFVLFNGDKEVGYLDTLEEAQRDGERYYAPHEGELKGPAETKFERYQLPGGSNYRELLFTLPSKRETLKWTPDEATEFQELAAKMRGDFGEEATPKERFRFFELQGKQSKANSADYKSSHWDEPNVIAHTRSNERADAEGRPGLFLEEVQSDWHQEGRKKGYKADTGKWVVKFPKEGEKVPWSSKGSTYNVFETKEAAQKVADSINGMADWGKHTGFTVAPEVAGEVPDAPFKNTWHELVFRRMVRQAAESGKDWLGWTTGEQQAERYDLSKHLDAIGYFKLGEDYVVTAFDKNGGTVWSNQQATPEIIGANLGKEIAEKMVAGHGEQESGVTYLRGVDLKVGCEGMKGFYDKILVDYANKFGKKFGAKVKDLAVPATGKQLDPAHEGETRLNELPDGTTEWQKAGATVKVHSLDIAPEMKKSVLEGQPLFSPIQETPGSEAQENGKFTPAEPTKDLKSEPGYVYHATSTERLADIAEGGMKLFKPSYGTEQSVWPDGSTDRRAYFSRDAGTVWQFAPEEGKPAIVRVKESGHEFKQERTTGDIYTRSRVPAAKIEFLGSDGAWHPVSELIKPAGPELSPAEETASADKWFEVSGISRYNGNRQGKMLQAASAGAARAKAELTLENVKVVEPVSKTAEQRAAEDAEDKLRIKQAEHYFSIGHDSEEGQVWIYDMASRTVKAKTGGTHGVHFGHDVADKAFKGWFDPDKGALSVVFPDSALRKLGRDWATEEDIPTGVYSALKRKFKLDKDTKVEVFPKKQSDYANNADLEYSPTSEDKSAERPEHVVSAAYKLTDGRIATGSAHALIDLPKGGSYDSAIDGFVTNKGRFLNRTDAYDLSQKIGQIDKAGYDKAAADAQGFDTQRLESVAFKNARAFSPVTEKPTIFYRGINKGDDRRIKEPFTVAKGLTFVARKRETALLYGKDISAYFPKPDAKLLLEGSKEFGAALGKKKYDPELDMLNQLSKGQSYVDAVNRVIYYAKRKGYDSVSFRSDETGTVILNEKAFTKKESPKALTPSEIASLRQDSKDALAEIRRLDDEEAAAQSAPEKTAPQP